MDQSTASWDFYGAGEQERVRGVIRGIVAAVHAWYERPPIRLSDLDRPGQWSL